MRAIVGVLIFGLVLGVPAGLFAQDEDGILKASEIEKRLDPGASAGKMKARGLTRGLTRGLKPRGVSVEETPSVTFHLSFKYDSTELADMKSQLQLAEFQGTLIRGQMAIMIPLPMI